MSDKKVILLIGQTGSGKSTTGDCILNKSGELSKLSSPFIASDSASSCTKEFKTESNDEFIVIDSIGFGDHQKDKSEILRELRQELAKTQNKIDCIIYVVQAGRFSKKEAKFLSLFSKKILKKKATMNSLLLITNARSENWIEKEKENSNLQKALQICNNLSYEFYLKFDDRDDTAEDKLNNATRRQNSINKFVEFLSQQTFEKLNLDFIQLNEFEARWNRYYPILNMLFEVVGAFGAFYEFFEIFLLS